MQLRRLKNEAETLLFQPAFFCGEEAFGGIAALLKSCLGMFGTIRLGGLLPRYVPHGCASLVRFQAARRSALLGRKIILPWEGTAVFSDHCIEG